MRNKAVGIYVHAADGELLHVMHGSVSGDACDVCLPCLWHTQSFHCLIAFNNC
jgi:hypothetical protein